MKNQNKNTPNEIDHKKLEETTYRELARLYIKNVFSETVSKNTPKKFHESKEHIQEEQVAEKLKNVSEIYKDAIILFKKYDSKKITEKIFKKLSDAEFNEFLFNPESGNIADYKVLKEIAMKVYKKELIDDAEKMFSFIAGLFPLQLEPFLILTAIIWKREGPEKAALIYEQLLIFMKNPLVHFYAADCFKAIGEFEKCNSTLREGLKLCKEMGDKEPQFLLLQKEFEKELQWL